MTRVSRCNYLLILFVEWLSFFVLFKLTYTMYQPRTRFRLLHYFLVSAKMQSLLTTHACMYNQVALREFASSSRPKFSPGVSPTGTRVVDYPTVVVISIPTLDILV